MSKSTLPISQVQISNKVGLPIKSPFRISNLKEMGINSKLFLEKFAPLFLESSHSIAQFDVSNRQTRHFISRASSSVYPSLSEIPDHYVEEHLFGTLLIYFYKLFQNIDSKNIVTILSHFQRIKISDSNPSQNLFDFSFDKKSNFIVPALIINQQNVEGGAFQILNKSKNNKVVFQYDLQSDEFAFHSNEVSEVIESHELSRHYTPFCLEKNSSGEGFVDIIRMELFEKEVTTKNFQF